MAEILVRLAESTDLRRLTEIYNHYVRTSPVTFDIEPFTIEQRRQWLEHYGPAGRHQLFVAVMAGSRSEADGGCEPVGYACSSPFRPKAAYMTSVETSVYVDHAWIGRGIGRALYTRLFTALEGEDVHRAYAGITLPNPASIALHEQFGFTPVGVYSHAGRKFDQYWDVAWYEKRL